MIISNKFYDVMKWILMIFVPAVITLITTLTMVWHWDIPLEAIVTTISAIATFFGALIGISTANYKKRISKSDEVNIEDIIS